MHNSLAARQKLCHSLGRCNPVTIRDSTLRHANIHLLPQGTNTLRRATAKRSLSVGVMATVCERASASWARVIPHCRLLSRRKGAHMGTTSTAVVESTLTALEAAGVAYAFLKGEDEASAGHIGSDVDLVVDKSPRQILMRVHKNLAREGVIPIMLWQYDVAAASLFLVNRFDLGGAQFDLTWDAQARGRYSLNATELLSSAHRGHRWLTIPHEVSTRHVENKARIKASRRNTSLTRTHARDIARYARRLKDPCGFCVAITGDHTGAVIAALQQTYGNLLPRLTTHRSVPGALFSARLLPSLCLVPTAKATPLRSIGPDLILNSESSGIDGTGVPTTVANAMNQRLLRSLA